MADLSLVFMIGLLGSIHCIGMCGGFAFAVVGMGGGAGSVYFRHLTYVFGKTITYTLLGAVAGGGGALLAAAFSEFQRGISIVLGLVLMGMGLHWMGFFRHLRLIKLNKIIAWKGVQRSVAFFLKRGAYYGAFGVGLINGFLPCTLVYALLTKAAATGTLLQGALTMAVFGLATIPSLTLVALTNVMIRPIWRNRLNRFSGILVVALGILTLIRGTDLMHGMMM